MSKLFGVILLVGGCLMLYEGRQSHEAAGSGSVWLLTLSPIAMILGLAALLRRSV